MLQEAGVGRMTAMRVLLHNYPFVVYAIISLSSYGAIKLVSYSPLARKIDGLSSRGVSEEKFRILNG